MLQLTTALETTSGHGLPRVVSHKPAYVRVAWLLLYLTMVALFAKGFCDFVIKLRSQQVTTSLEANKFPFQFPDLYACFGSPVSASYSANVDKQTADYINAWFEKLAPFVSSHADINVIARMFANEGSAFFPSSLPYDMLVDSLAHRIEQAVIDADLRHNTEMGMPKHTQIEAESFYHPKYLRCIKWPIESDLKKKIPRDGSQNGLMTTLLLDADASDMQTKGAFITSIRSGSVSLSPQDWYFGNSDFPGTDRHAGVRVFLTPPGEYPSDFVTSFSLGPGKHHTVEIDMTQQVYKDGQFDCVTDTPNVQFVNPYDQTPYNHTHSYSYCYYHEYHRQFQMMANMSGDMSPLPWSLKEMKSMVNVSGYPNLFTFKFNSDMEAQYTQIERNTRARCQSKRPCSTLDYSVSISSADWPTQSSLAPFVSSSIKQAWTKAKAKNLSVPALDFLLTGNASSVASYVRSNLLKVHFKPHRVLCDRVTFSKDYGLPDFISDIGGIMGIYLGMSLLTLCELLELFYDLLVFYKHRNKTAMDQSDRTKSAVFLKHDAYVGTDD